jgi:hypothetical protein
MTVSITDLTYTNNIDNNRAPIKTDLDSAFQSIEDYINTTVVDALIQYGIDIYGSGGSLSAAGTALFASNNLYNKQTAERIYTGGDVTISTTGAWTDVDTSNASIPITPDTLSGDFKASCHFSMKAVSSNATNQARVRFRLTDSTESSNPVEIDFVTGVSGTTDTTPIFLAHQFDDWAVSAQTVKLQYFIVTSTAMTITVLANTNCPIAMQVEKI